MPRLTNRNPVYRHHKPSDQARVRLGGVDHYLGPWGSKASKLAYERLVAEWIANGRRPLDLKKAQYPGLAIVELIDRHQVSTRVTASKTGSQPTSKRSSARLFDR